MERSNEGTSARETSSPAANRGLIAQPNFNTPAKPIAEVVTRPDFPEGVLGEHVDIGGYAGVVVAVVKHSIKVRSPEGVTRSFNSYGLRRIYGPPPPEPEPMQAAASPPAPAATAPVPPPKAAPAPEVIAEPNFDQPLTPISSLVARPDFPQCAFGRHVDIGGYTGVVVQILNQSLKVRSRQGTSRNYNAVGLRNIYGRK